MIFLKKWRAFELIWLFVFTTIAIGLNYYWNDTFFNLIVFTTGVLCVVLAAKGHIWTYFFGMINTVSYAYIAYNNGLYGEMGLNVFFFIPTNIIGYMMWKNKMHDDQVEMRGLRNITRAVISISCLFCIYLLGYSLSKITGQNTPYIDATTNILSIAATLLMIYRYKEQWLLYIILNVFTILMWAIRTINGSENGPVMMVMWSAYLINAVYGYYNWHIGSRQYAGALK